MENGTDLRRISSPVNGKGPLTNNFVKDDIRSGSSTPSGRSSPRVSGPSSRVDSPAGDKVSQALKTPARRKTETDRGRVKVSIRVRPWTPIEEPTREEGAVDCLDLGDDRKSLKLTLDGEGRQFKFDSVLPPSTTQYEAYECVAQSVVHDVLNGYNGTVMAYGQTGAGKTHTILGEKGIIAQSMNEIFDHIKEQEDHEYIVSISFLQIYMEQVQDLLSLGSENLQIREMPDIGVAVQGISSYRVETTEHVMCLLERGYERRSVAATQMNDISSRSHVILMVDVQRRNKASSRKMLFGKLMCVDLAGSERIKKSGSMGLRLDEAKAINLSLSALGNVVAALASKASHIPFRDSKLTRLLQDSLGGNSKTSLCVNVGPSSYNAHETWSSLQFAQRAMNVPVKPVINEVIDYTLMCQELQAQVKYLEQRLKTGGIEGDPKVQGEISKLINENQALRAECQEKDQQIKDLEEQLDEVKTKPRNLMPNMSQQSGAGSENPYAQELADKDVEIRMLRAQLEDFIKSSFYQKGDGSGDAPSRPEMDDRAMQTEPDLDFEKIRNDIATAKASHVFAQKNPGPDNTENIPPPAETPEEDTSLSPSSHSIPDLAASLRQLTSTCRKLQITHKRQLADLREKLSCFHSSDSLDSPSNPLVPEQLEPEA